MAAVCPGVLHHPDGQRGRGLGRPRPELLHEQQEAGRAHCGQRHPRGPGRGDGRLRRVQCLQLDGGWGCGQLPG